MLFRKVFCLFCAVIPVHNGQFQGFASIYICFSRMSYHEHFLEIKTGSDSSDTISFIFSFTIFFSSLQHSRNLLKSDSALDFAFLLYFSFFRQN